MAYTNTANHGKQAGVKFCTSAVARQRDFYLNVEAVVVDADGLGKLFVLGPVGHVVAHELAVERLALRRVPNDAQTRARGANLVQNELWSRAWN